MTKQKPSAQFRRLVDSSGRGEQLVPHLESALLTQGEKTWPEEYAIHVVNKERVWDGYFHPSSDALEPALHLYYKFHPGFTIERERLSVSDIMTFQIGSCIHALMQSMMIHLGFTDADQCEYGFVDKERMCSGSVDVRSVRIPAQEVTPPVEIKSAGWLPKEPFANHVAQVNLYMDQACDKVPFGLLLYVEKNHPHRMKEFTVYRDEDLINGIYAKWRRVAEAIAFDDPSEFMKCCDKPSCPTRMAVKLETSNSTS